TAREDVRLHHRRWLCDADVHEVTHLPFQRRIHGGETGRQVDAPELFRLDGTGMRRSYELNERVRGPRLARVLGRVERVADDVLHTGWKAGRPTAAHQRTHDVAAREQCVDQRAADVARAPRDEDMSTPERHVAAVSSRFAAGAPIGDAPASAPFAL